MSGDTCTPIGGIHT